MAELDTMYKHFTKYERNVIIKGTNECVVACRAIWGMHKKHDLEDKKNSNISSIGSR